MNRRFDLWLCSLPELLRSSLDIAVKYCMTDTHTSLDTLVFFLLYTFFTTCVV